MHKLKHLQNKQEARKKPNAPSLHGRSGEAYRPLSAVVGSSLVTSTLLEDFSISNGSDFMNLSGSG